MKPDKAIDLLGPFDPNQRCPALLDANAVDPFITWLENNIDYLDHLERGHWQIGVLRPHVENRNDWDTLQSKLVAAHIRLLDDTLTNKDEPLVGEILNAYFGGNGVHRKSARLLAYGRKHSEDTDDVQVISRLRTFRLIPNVQLYFIPGVDYKQTDDDALILRALDTLELHRHVNRVAYDRVVNRDYPLAIDQAVKMLIDEIRQIGVDHSLAFVNEVNDRPMVDLAFRTTEPDGRGGRRGCRPAIQINHMSSPSENSEQQGYHDIIHGVVGAVRNPLSHAPVDLPFLQSRFGDRRTALKFLCLLSLLFEKLDARVAP